MLFAFAATAAVVLVPFASNCNDPPPPPVFEGARPWSAASFREGETPATRAVEQLVDAAIEVAGGASRLHALSWKRVEDVYLSHTSALNSNRAKCTTLVRPDQSIRVHLQYPEGQDELRVMFRGEEYLRPLRDVAQSNAQVELRLATGATQQFVVWDWEIARLPAIVAEAAGLTPLPTRVEDGRTLVGMRVDVAEMNPKFEAWIDLAGPMVVEVRAELPLTSDLSPGGMASQRTRFSDFRRVKDVLFPFRKEVWVEDVRAVLAEAHTIEVDVEPADAEFMAK